MDEATTPLVCVDLGSNSFHLLKASECKGAVRILTKAKERVHLADGLDENEQLSDTAIDRGLACLARFAEVIGDLPARQVRTVATFTLRQARNRDAFLKAARAVYPYPIEVISGAEEARLIYQGVVYHQPSELQQLVVDIGGGSTECIIGKQGKAKQLASLAMGCVSYQSFFADGLSAAAFRQAETAARQELEQIEQRYRKVGWQQALGCSGTIKAIQGCIAQLYPAETTITLKRLKGLRKQCIQAGRISKLNLPGVSSDRQLVFAPGLAILLAVFRTLGIKEMQYNDTALREGLLQQMLPGKPMDSRQQTVTALQALYHVDQHQAERVKNSALKLWEQLARQERLGELLAVAADLHEVGLQINFHGVQRHSAYILQHSDMTGFNQDEQLLLATLVRYSRKSLKQLEWPTLSLFSQAEMALMLRVLRLAVLIHRRRQNPRKPQPLQLSEQDGKLLLSLPTGWLNRRPLLSADLAQEQRYQRQADWLFELSLFTSQRKAV